ncbi:O-antigen ligase family protein [Candidatus Laterigemmans baculatus]|uniref:O-antigen ligase family protein n=1 Tax=Candidatus Laterigemmans baculatus TaxID=2770505 RepID=UPI0013DC094B|nr:O-antigen ligase family protein [Candidatus Laterigemmans baculatus]
MSTPPPPCKTGRGGAAGLAGASPLAPPASQIPWLLAGPAGGWLALGSVAMVAVAAIALDQPLLALLAGAAVPAVLLTVVWSEGLIPQVIFILYSNAAVVAVRFHGVPGPAAALLPAVLAIPLLRYILLDGRPLILTSTLPWVLLFMLVQTLGVLVARYPEEAWKNVQTMVLEGLALYVVITNVIRSRTTLRWAIGALLLAGGFMGGLSVYQQATRTFDNHYGGFAQVPGLGFAVAEDGVEHRQARLCGPVGEQNRYAQIMLMLVPLGYFYCLSETSRKRQAWAAVATLLSAAGCVLAFSRGTAVAFALMLVLMTMMGQLRIRHLLVLVLATLLLLVASPQYLIRLASIQSLVDVAVSGHTAEGELDGATRGRLTVMFAAARVAADYPLTGVGPGMFNHYSRAYGNDGGLRALEGTREAHCLYLQLAAEHGLPGLVCFLAMLGAAFRGLVQTRRIWQVHDPQLANWATGFLLALASYVATSLFLHFSYARYFWLILAISDATSYLGRQFALRHPLAPPRAPRASLASSCVPNPHAV